MKRRQFVGAASAGLAAALWPSMVREAFAQEEGCDGSPLARVALVAAAFRRARASGRPLLIFVVPAEDGAKWRRGEVFGELINHGSDRDLAPLAGAEVVCATMEDLRRLVPNVGTGEPLMVLVRPDKVPATARQLDVELAPPADWDGSWEEHQRKEDEVSDKHIAAMGDLLRRSLGDPGKRAATLAAEVRARLKDKPPPGTKWAHSAGCGVDIEGERDQMMVSCGMGSVPKKAQRFLYFFSKRRF
jgi:hypothetical protein